MAKIGLDNFKYAILTEAADGTPSYGTAKKPAKAIDCKVSIETNSAELYADDGVAETDYTFKKGTATITIDDENDEIMAELLGHTITEGEMVRKDTDIAPYVGFGRILTKIVNGVYKYKVEFLAKVKFKEPSAEESTKVESVEFKTASIEGTVMKLKSGIWSKTKTFTTRTEAETYLDSCFTPATQSE